MKRLLLFALIALSFGAYAQVENEEELDPEYTERSYEEVRIGNPATIWKKHPNPSSYKGSLSFEASDDGSVAVLGDDMLLFTERVSEHIQIVVEGRDFYVVFDESNRVITVKHGDGRQISKMLVPMGCSVIWSISMTEDEAYYRPYAFEIEDVERGESRFYDKRCVLLDKRGL
jgi:hypothetical protein